MHKTPALTNLFILALARFFRTLLFPWQPPFLAVLSPWKLKSLKPGMCRLYDDSGTVTRHGSTAVILHSSFLFFSGSKVTKLTLAYTWSPLPPSLPPSHPHTHARDRLQTQMARSILIFMINKTFYISPLTSVFNTAFHSLPSAAWICYYYYRQQLPMSSSVSSLSAIVVLKTHHRDLQRVFQ